MKRYFLFTYFTIVNGIQRWGNMTLSYDGFPSHRHLKTVLNENLHVPYDNITIQTWTEFDNEDDFNSFNQ